MPDRNSLEEWHARMMWHKHQHAEASASRVLDERATLQERHAQAQTMDHGRAFNDGRPIMQNYAPHLYEHGWNQHEEHRRQFDSGMQHDMVPDRYVPGDMPHSCARGWNQQGVNRQQFGSAIQNEVIGDHYVPGDMAHLSGHGWNQLEENRQQFGYAEPTSSWNEYIQKYEATQPPPPLPLVPTKSTRPAFTPAAIKSQLRQNMQCGVEPAAPPPNSQNVTMGCSISGQLASAIECALQQQTPPPNSQNISMGCSASGRPNSELPQHTPPPISQSAAAGCSTHARPTIKGIKVKNKPLSSPGVSPMEAQEGTAAATDDAGSGSRSFRTDKEISGADGRVTERPLQRWEDDSVDPNVILDPIDKGSINKSGPSSKARQGVTWNQFEANEMQFGVVSTFKSDLSQYSTKLDLKLVPDEVKNWAKHVAQDIENKGKSKRWCDQYDGDEEELWSSVAPGPTHEDRNDTMPPPPPPPPRGQMCRPTWREHQRSEWEADVPYTPFAAAAR